MPGTDDDATPGCGGGHEPSAQAGAPGSARTAALCSWLSPAPRTSSPVGLPPNHVAVDPHHRRCRIHRVRTGPPPRGRRGRGHGTRRPAPAGARRPGPPRAAARRGGAGPGRRHRRLDVGCGAQARDPGPHCPPGGRDGDGPVAHRGVTSRTGQRGRDDGDARCRAADRRRSRAHRAGLVTGRLRGGPVGVGGHDVLARPSATFRPRDGQVEPDRPRRGPGPAAAQPGRPNTAPADQRVRRHQVGAGERPDGLVRGHGVGPVGAAPAECLRPGAVAHQRLHRHRLALRAARPGRGGPRRLRGRQDHS